MAHQRGYQAFGSFFSDNVEDMIRSNDEPLDPASVVPDADLLPAAPVGLGAAAREHYLVDFSTWTFLNHGAFGCGSGLFRAPEAHSQSCRGKAGRNV